jgi:hypothetical protein
MRSGEGDGGLSPLLWFRTQVPLRKLQKREEGIMGFYLYLGLVFHGLECGQNLMTAKQVEVEMRGCKNEGPICGQQPYLRALKAPKRPIFDSKRTVNA